MLIVGFGGIFGAGVRYLLSKWITSRTSARYPFGTWIINSSGSFLLGILAVIYLNNIISEWVWLLIGTGFLGAFTTFSTFGYETIQMLQKKEIRNAVIYVLTSVVWGIIFAWMGCILGSLWVTPTL